MYVTGCNVHSYLIYLSKYTFVSVQIFDDTLPISLLQKAIFILATYDHILTSSRTVVILKVFGKSWFLFLPLLIK